MIVARRGMIAGSRRPRRCRATHHRRYVSTPSNATGEREERQRQRPRPRQRRRRRRRRRQRQRRRQRRQRRQRRRASPLRLLRGLGTDFAAPAIASERPTGGQCGASTGTRTRPSARNGSAGDSTATTVTLDRGGGWGPVRRGLGGEAPNVTGCGHALSGRDDQQPLPCQLATTSSPYPARSRLPAALALPGRDSQQPLPFQVATTSSPRPSRSPPRLRLIAFPFDPWPGMGCWRRSGRWRRPASSSFLFLRVRRPCRERGAS